MPDALPARRGCRVRVHWLPRRRNLSDIRLLTVAAQPRLAARRRVGMQTPWCRNGESRPKGLATYASVAWINATVARARGPWCARPNGEVPWPEDTVPDPTR